MSPINNNFNMLLAKKETREKRNIPISEVARETGISRRALDQWAKNSVARFDAPVIEALCNYFGCSVGDLIIHETIQQ